MRTLGSKLLASCVLVFLSTSSPLPAGTPWYPIKSFTDPKIYQQGEWELRIYFRHKGNSTESMNGDLRYQGKRLIPVMPAGFIRTPLGDLTFLPAGKKLDRPNTIMGWTFKDFEKIPWTASKHPNFAPRSDWREAEIRFAE